MLFPTQITMIRAWTSNKSLMFQARQSGKTYAWKLLKKIGNVAAPQQKENNE